MSKTGFVYILTNKSRSVLYTGVTSSLKGRTWQHRTGAVPGFTSRYKVTDLVYYEVCGEMVAAIAREKQVKNYSRLRKTQLITKFNPEWRDLYDEL
jgi:putative endonuclease